MKTTILNLILCLFSISNQNLDGRWQATTAVLAGNAFPPAVVKEIALMLHDGTYQLGIDKGFVKLLPENRMEITGNEGPNNGKTYKAIYELAGDELMICYDLSGTTFPESFESPVNTKIFMVKYIRVK